MDPITISVVSALAAGATAVGKEFATAAIKDSYKALKAFVLKRFAGAEAFVQAVEDDPGSEPEQQVLAKKITGIGEAGEVKALVQTLISEIEAVRDAPGAAAVFDFDTLRAVRNFEIDGATFSGTLLRARDATFEGDFKATNIRQEPPEENKKKD